MDLWEVSPLKCRKKQESRYTLPPSTRFTSLSKFGYILLTRIILPLMSNNLWCLDSQYTSLYRKEKEQFIRGINYRLIYKFTQLPNPYLRAMDTFLSIMLVRQGRIYFTWKCCFAFAPFSSSGSFSHFFKHWSFLWFSWPFTNWFVLLFVSLSILCKPLNF